MSYNPSCRICKVLIDKKKEIEGVDWIMPSAKHYYHKSCYETWKANLLEGEKKDADWISLIYDFLARELKVSYNYFLCNKQIQKFQRENKINPKGIYFTLKYFYQIKHNPWEGNGGIGIVPYVFKEAKDYWIQQERKKRGLLKEIEKQAIEQQVIKIKRNNIKRDKYNLDDIGGED